MEPKQDPRVRRAAAETREHVLAVTHELFYWNGIRATGVDRIAADAGIAPTTLYRLFASKDDLVAAYIERADRLYRSWFNEAAGTHGSGPREQILGVFDALAEQVLPQHCRGCPFLMALAEFPDRKTAVHGNAVTLKGWVRQRFGELTEELAVTTPVGDTLALADDLVVVMEGAYASAQALGAAGPAKRARAIAETLIDTAAAA